MRARLAVAGSSRACWVNAPPVMKTTRLAVVRARVRVELRDRAPMPLDLGHHQVAQDHVEASRRRRAASSASRRARDRDDLVLRREQRDEGSPDAGSSSIDQDPRARDVARWRGGSCATAPAARRDRQRHAERACRHPTVLVTAISPPIERTIWCEIASPSPMPDAGRLGREERIEDRDRSMSARDAHAGVLDLDDHALAGVPRAPARGPRCGRRGPRRSRAPR